MSEEYVYVPPATPVFPLPGVVLFPHTLVPLHVFEPRYREMVADAVEGDRIISLALLKTGWESLYYTRRAPIHPTVGLGHVAEYEQLPDGNYNMLIRGIGRAIVTDELAEHAYRVARVEVLESYTDGDEDAQRDLRDELFGAIESNDALEDKLRENWLRLRTAPVDLTILTDLIAAGLPGAAELRQCLLDEPDAISRGQILIEQINTIEAVARRQRQASRPDAHSLN